MQRCTVGEESALCFHNKTQRTGLTNFSDLRQNLADFCLRSEVFLWQAFLSLRLTKEIFAEGKKTPQGRRVYF